MIQEHHHESQWRARREAQIEAAIAANREYFDDADDCEVTPRPRWFDAAENTGLVLLLCVAVVVVCVAITLSPLIALAAHLRGSVTP